MLAIHGTTGTLVGTTSGFALTTLGYSGEHFDAKAQQQYLRARWYDPANGRFNRLDPFAGDMQDPLSLHKYAYVHGDPIGGVDPTGEFLGVGVAFAVILIIAFNANTANAPSPQDRTYADDTNLLYEVGGAVVGLGLGRFVFKPLFSATGPVITRIFRGSANKIAGTLAKELRHTPLARNITHLADDTIVSFGRNAHSVVKPGAGGKLYAWRWGDVKNLSPSQVETLIGDMAEAGLPGGARVMHVLKASAKEFEQVPGPLGYVEYVARTAKEATEGWIVQ